VLVVLPLLCSEWGLLPARRDQPADPLPSLPPSLPQGPPRPSTFPLTTPPPALCPSIGQLVTLIFPVSEPQRPLQALDRLQGPPFQVTPALYQHLLVEGEGEGGGGFACLELTGPLTDSIPPRQGREWWGRWAVPA